LVDIEDSKIFNTTSNINQNTNIYLKRYTLESKFFFFKKKFSQRKNKIKLTVRSIIYIYDKVRKDYFLNLRYGLKTYYNINTGIITSLIEENKKFPLISASLLQNKYKDLAIYQKQILFRSNQDFRYRNILLKLKPLKKQLYLINVPLIAKPLNKFLYFTLLTKYKGFSFKDPLFILYRYRKKSWIQIYQLGFTFNIKINRKTLKKSYINLRLLAIKNKIKKNKLKFRKILNKRSQKIKKFLRSKKVKKNLKAFKLTKIIKKKKNVFIKE
jgi:hypothetical protein